MYFIAAVYTTMAEKLLVHPKTSYMKNSVRIKSERILSDETYQLKEITFERSNEADRNKEQSHEVYDIGNAAAVLLYNPEKRTVILIKQFRLPAYLNGDISGILLEVCAGKIDKESPEECIKREIEEETGYRVPEVHQIFRAYSSPGTVTEIIYYFIAQYDGAMKRGPGGGLKEENEEVEVLEIPYNEALEMVASGQIADAKTIMLLLYAQTRELM